MRFLRLLFVFFLLAAIAAGCVAAVVYLPYGPQRVTFVDIAPGTGTPGIAAQLKRAGIIRSATAFEAMRALRGSSLKAGEYRFDHPVKLSEVYTRIHRGDVYTVTLLVPEGFNIFDIAAAADAAKLAKREDFLRAEQTDTKLIAKWSPHATSLEGFLFPDTYKFSRHSTPQNMLSIMVKRFAQEVERMQLPDAKVAELTTMASLVEKEVHIDSERPLVAGVFANRMAAGMPLQTDPAVAYASMLRGTWTGVIHQSELHSDSPYNTYTHPGLPPGPICNPGLASFRAAMRPRRSEYLYFVADANGATRFSRTLEEHLSNVASYRKSTAP